MNLAELKLLEKSATLLNDVWLDEETYKDALKDSTAYEMLYKKKTFDTEFKQIIEESDYNGNRRISDNDRDTENVPESRTATSSTNAGIERKLTAVGRVIERRNRQRKQYN
jgi:hypothetical protein